MHCSRFTRLTLMRTSRRLLAARLTLQGQRNSLALDVYLKHSCLDDLTGLDGVARVFDETIGQLRHMGQSVLMDANVDECSKRRNVGDHTL